MELVPAEPIFLLGIQRSGTTWLTNLFDSSSHTLTFMEPLSAGLGLAPEYPDRLSWLRGTTPELTELLAGELPRRLERAKYLVLRRSLGSPGLFRFERAFARLALGSGPLLPLGLHRRCFRFQQINLNRFEPDAPLVRKVSPMTWVIKELRLSGTVPIVRAAFPSARFLVIIRHPVDTVLSMLRWIRKGRLLELRDDLVGLAARLRSERLGDDYNALIERAEASGVAAKLALYWRVCYESLIRDVPGSLSTFVTLEELSDQPGARLREVFAKVGLPYEVSVQRYLDRSTSSAGGKGVLSTTRPRSFHRQERSKGEKDDLAGQILEITADSPLMDLFGSL